MSMTGHAYSDTYPGSVVGRIAASSGSRIAFGCQSKVFGVAPVLDVAPPTDAPRHSVNSSLPGRSVDGLLPSAYIISVSDGYWCSSGSYWPLENSSNGTTEYVCTTASWILYILQRGDISRNSIRERR